MLINQLNKKRLKQQAKLHMCVCSVLFTDWLANVWVNHTHTCVCTCAHVKRPVSGHQLLATMNE